MATSPENERPKFEFDAETIQNPYPAFARLRAAAPVFEARPNSFLVARYADAVACLKDPRFGRSGFEADMLRAQGIERSYALPMMFSDPPDHTRLRNLLNRAFSLRVVQALVPRVESVTKELLDRVDAQGSFDLVKALAYPLPVKTICYLLGVTADDQDRIHDLSEAHAAALACGVLNDETRPIIERADRLRKEWAAYFGKLAEERRTHPREDLISELVKVHDTSSEKLTEYELLATLTGLLFAGHTTTADAIGNGVFALLSHRDQWELLVREPSKLDDAVEEVLRWDPPVQIFARRVLEDADLAGVPMAKGASAFVLSGAANRDPDQFSNPEQFDITRSPNKHIAFGSGIHFCMGSTLARMQIKAVLRALCERYPKLTLSSGSITYKTSIAFRGLTRLDVNETS